MKDKRVWLKRPPDRRAANWEVIAQELMDNEGQWLMLFEQVPTSIARAIAQGSIAALRKNKGFRIVTRNNTREPPRTCDIYLSYHPTEAPPERERKADHHDNDHPAEADDGTGTSTDDTGTEAAADTEDH